MTTTHGTNFQMCFDRLLACLEQVHPNESHDRLESLAFKVATKVVAEFKKNRYPEKLSVREAIAAGIL